MSGADQADAIGKARALREQLLADRYRPGYHFVVPEDIGIPGDPNGGSCEIRLSIDPMSSYQVGVQIRTSPNGEETTLLYYDTSTRKLVFDATRSGERGRKVIEEAPFELADQEPLELRIFVDHSVVEVFANDRQGITRRVYPVRNDSDQVKLFCSGGEAHFGSIETWEMMPSNAW